ncbi:helix-turn-helix domain-containing protein [Roseivirga pacifica]|uniref:helix-turn-helix domain-containing protein n=1 Tax=Roseivirga pacifica TaxID=1267423 RepID=UPI0020949F4E|nr:helix-turn-helix domain-containing protein [Roseivirga pacifica]MCO6358192.1 hypothetical protein [Roseivirga pacifica]MCO6366630.1 hypothetical protein [Roseivirga pacifica]MCO6371115.1 hypothetical protein [Roseivirga pacifica]MCO6373923.1 hypothetical protein [Roseivirga pacifica]MCO6380904.1 hypothetical protein [Roseivirga pacifica]
MIKYTTINHEARLLLGLSSNQFAIADSIYKLSTNPKAKQRGWCNASKDALAEFLGDVSRRTVINYINTLQELGLVERNESNSKLLRTTEKWYDVVVCWDNYCEKTAQDTVKEFHSACEKTAHQSVKELHSKCENFSQPSNNNINSTDNKNINRLKPVCGNDLSKTLDENRVELVEFIKQQPSLLLSLERTTNVGYSQLEKFMSAWAKENEATQFQSQNHIRNSYKRFVQIASKKAGKATEQSTVMPGAILSAAKRGGVNA